MEINSKWYEEFEKQEKPYKDFYLEKPLNIKLYFFYVNQSNEIDKIKQKEVELDNDGKISREKLINLIKQNIIENKIRYSLLSILKHNISLNPENLKKYLENNIDNSENNYLELIPEITDIYFKDTITFLNNLNSIFIVFNETSFYKKSRKGMTKKIYISTKQHRKTKRKPFKKTKATYST